MKRLNSIKSAFYSLLAVLLLVGCGNAKERESLEPLYQPEPLRLSDSNIVVEYWGDVGSTTIEPTIFRKLFRWIPIVGDLVELPLDLLTIIMPAMPSSSFPQLPKDAAWNDPRVLSAVKSLKLTDGYIRIIPVAERGPNYQPDRCGFHECEEQSLDFLEEISVYLIFKDPKSGHIKKLDGDDDKVVLLARADTSGSNYDRQNQVLHFVSTNKNLRTMLVDYGSFDVKVIAKGKPPGSTVYLDGRLRIEAELDLGE